MAAAILQFKAYVGTLVFSQTGCCCCFSNPAKTFAVKPKTKEWDREKKRPLDDSLVFFLAIFLTFKCFLSLGPGHPTLRGNQHHHHKQGVYDKVMPSKAGKLGHAARTAWQQQSEPLTGILGSIYCNSLADFMRNVRDKWRECFYNNPWTTAESSI